MQIQVIQLFILFSDICPISNHVVVATMSHLIIVLTLEINPELEEKIANITKLVQAEIEEEKLRKRQQGVLVEEHGSSNDVDDATTLIPVTLKSLLNYSKWVRKEGMDTSETLYMKILKGIFLICLKNKILM